MKVRYVGPSGDGVNVTHDDPEFAEASTVTACPPGEPVDLPDEQAASLVEAGVFEVVTEPRRKPAGRSEEDA